MPFGAGAGQACASLLPPLLAFPTRHHTQGSNQTRNLPERFNPHVKSERDSQRLSTAPERSGGRSEGRLGKRGALVAGASSSSAFGTRAAVQPGKMMQLLHHFSTSRHCFEISVESLSPGRIVLGAGASGRGRAGTAGPWAARDAGWARGRLSPGLPEHAGSSRFSSSAPLAACFPEAVEGFAQSISCHMQWTLPGASQLVPRVCGIRGLCWIPSGPPLVLPGQMGPCVITLKLLVVGPRPCPPGGTGALPAARRGCSSGAGAHTPSPELPSSSPGLGGWRAPTWGLDSLRLTATWHGDKCMRCAGAFVPQPFTVPARLRAGAVVRAFGSALRSSKAFRAVWDVPITPRPLLSWWHIPLAGGGLGKKRVLRTPRSDTALTRELGCWRWLWPLLRGGSLGCPAG